MSEDLHFPISPPCAVLLSLPQSSSWPGAHSSQIKFSFSSRHLAVTPQFGPTSVCKAHLSLPLSLTFSTPLWCLRETKHCSTFNSQDVSLSQNAPHAFSIFPKLLPTNLVQVPPPLQDVTYICCHSIFGSCVHFGTILSFSFASLS